MIRGKCILLNASINNWNEGRSQGNILNSHIKKVEKEEQSKPKTIRMKQRIKTKKKPMKLKAKTIENIKDET